MSNLSTAPAFATLTATALGLGPRHSCVVAADGSVNCWGDSNVVPGAAYPSSATPTNIPSVSGLVVGTGGDHLGCSLDNSGLTTRWWLGPIFGSGSTTFAFGKVVRSWGRT